MALLNVNNLQKVYTTRLGGAKVQALAGVSFTVEEGEFVAIMGCLLYTSPSPRDRG